jgi:glyoxylase-like metal-dependent hydrolase (beta-lactamase superfamily II)
MEIKIISAGTFKLDGGAMFGIIPKTLWSSKIPSDINNRCTWDTRCILVEIGNRLVLIDTGMGNKQAAKWRSYYEPQENQLLINISKAGYTPDQITDVILSHFHFDHCGGAVSLDSNTGKYYSTFKNAKYWSHSKHWAWALNSNPKEKGTFLNENFMPLLEHDQLFFLDKEVIGIKEFEFIFTSGHTESMILTKITKGNTNIIFAADTIPSHAHVALPYIMAYDNLPLTTIEEKAKILNEAVEKNDILVFDHDPFFEAALIQKTDKGFSSINFANLSELL